jgi:hypothetical protein
LERGLLAVEEGELVHCHPPSTALTADGDVLGVATERCDVLDNPLDTKASVEKADVSQAPFVERPLSVEESE